ncbi:ABC transporter ATP-binding protein [Alsobacter metallidurans]|uniref:ABC transporter ATP-binding protein n=1 Tax=Alsobacter metallidurans TaxID=340221 RepID=A0A917MKG6_9HYPH|nr:ABC transporter ATP-binding protein [Alsobacter metallidurans]GGH23587.1 ABC transporter ATP-binding protein [Alsobacter metallidurans]
MMAAPSSALLDVRDLHVRFATARGEVRAVDGVNLSVAPGETLGLVGESGSGKSVTLRAILRLLRANAAITGEVRWQGENLLALPEKRLRDIRGKDIAVIFQEPMSALNPVISIGRQIDESLVAHTALDAAGRRRRAIELLDLVGIASPEQRLAGFPHEFSGGMRQRAMIAIALAAEPKLLLADEPTTALDVTIQDQILKLLLRLNRELGMGLILVTHDLGVVAETCDRVSVMYAGRVVESGPVDRVFTAPRHAYTDALLRSMPHGGAARAPLRPIPGQPPRLDRAIAGCPFAPRCALVEDRCTVEAPPFAVVAPDQRAACWASDRLAAREGVA